MKINDARELNAAIVQLKLERVNKEQDILSALKIYAVDIKNTAVNISLGVGSGMAAKKILPGKDSIIKKLMANIIQGVVTTAVISNADKIKAVVGAIAKNFLSKKSA